MNLLTLPMRHDGDPDGKSGFIATFPKPITKLDRAERDLVLFRLGIEQRCQVVGLVTRFTGRPRSVLRLRNLRVTDDGPSLLCDEGWSKAVLYSSTNRQLAGLRAYPVIEPGDEVTVEVSRYDDTGAFHRPSSIEIALMVGPVTAEESP